VAERVERLSRQLDSSLVITDAVLEAANVEQDDWEAMPPMAIKGRTAGVRIFRLRQGYR
jgi:class 3 adenylate cyclase